MGEMIYSPADLATHGLPRGYRATTQVPRCQFYQLLQGYFDSLHTLKDYLDCTLRLYWSQHAITHCECSVDP
jgi:hypothetical protein